MGKLAGDDSTSEIKDIQCFGNNPLKEISEGRERIGTCRWSRKHFPVKGNVDSGFISNKLMQQCVEWWGTVMNNVRLLVTGYFAP